MTPAVEFTEVTMSYLSQLIVGMVFPIMGLPGRFTHNLSTKGKHSNRGLEKKSAVFSFV